MALRRGTSAVVVLSEFISEGSPRGFGFCGSRIFSVGNRQCRGDTTLLCWLLRATPFRDPYITSSVVGVSLCSL